MTIGEEPKLIKTCNSAPKFKFKPKEFHRLVEILNLFTHNKRLSHMNGVNAYAFNGDLADLERAVIRYTVSFLLQRGFVLISVPDLLYSHVIERCGMQTRGPVSQVFHLNNFENEDVCLSGTAEMGIGGYLQDRIIEMKDLPMKLFAVSRCYRDERGCGASEKGIYRIHVTFSFIRVPQFNKVEMFAVTANETGNESEELYQELIDIQTDLYSALDFQFKVIDMPLNDLGDQAYKKTDIEAWIPIQKIFGEISSTSNCIDYQSRRLNIRYRNKAGDIKFAHTLNGTACATPRILIPMVSSNQTKDGDVLIPEALQPFFNYKHIIRKEKSFLQLKHFNSRTFTGEILQTNDELEVDSV
ncbi:Serine--tRNA ligase, mitochondrial [Armadillidium vulgare]|nr:Serine--tRNA ligase, mitochondrial [Armadillidium vulgare]